MITQEKMTKEEAIPFLESTKRMKTILPKTREALDVAIESLKTELITTASKSEDKKKDHMLAVLFNRCLATTHLCFWCGLRNECDQYRTIGKGERE